MYFAAGETVTVLRPAKVDNVGDPTGAPADHDIAGCAINWLSSSENTDRRETTTALVEVYCPAGADILATDRVRLPDGRVFRVDGAPASWHNPFTGWDAGIVVRLRGVV